MPLYQVNAGDRILAADINQFYNILKGVAASGEAVTLIYNSTSLIFQPSSDPSAGTRMLDIKNAAGTHLASLDFNGVLELLAAAAAPSGAVAGAAYFDTLLTALRVYDGTNWNTLGASVAPNLVLNSDFGRRNYFGLSMPEAFADTSGYTDTGAATVGSNIVTFNGANEVLTWPKSGSATFWRDGRASATFKAVDTTKNYVLEFRVADTNNFVRAYADGAGNFILAKVIAGSPTTLASVAQALTVNQWYFIDLEAQGTTFIAKFYTTGTTTAGTVKASATLTQTLVGTAADAGVASGGVAISSSAAAAQWGGIATSNGGVYVETWLPEDLVPTPGGTLGGQAVAYDDTADSGPIGRQIALKVYIPAASRTWTGQISTQVRTGSISVGNITPSVAYVQSVYLKTSGIGGSGVLGQVQTIFRNAAQTDQGSSLTISDAGETSWTRKSATGTSPSGTRTASALMTVNPSSTATGTVYFQLLQLEQGSAATAWRNAPSDFSPLVWFLVLQRDITTTSASMAEIESRDMAANIYLPFDGWIRVETEFGWKHSVLNSTINTDIAYDGSDEGDAQDIAVVANVVKTIRHGTYAALGTVGKHRVAARWATSAATATIVGTGATLTTLSITLTFGR